MNQPNPEEVIHWLNRCPVANWDICQSCPYNNNCDALLSDAAYLLKAAYSGKES